MRQHRLRKADDCAERVALDNGGWGGGGVACVTNMHEAARVVAADGVVTLQPPWAVWNLVNSSSSGVNQTTFVEPNQTTPLLLQGAANIAATFNVSVTIQCGADPGMCILDCQYASGPGLELTGVRVVCCA